MYLVSVVGALLVVFAIFGWAFSGVYPIIDYFPVFIGHGTAGSALSALVTGIGLMIISSPFTGSFTCASCGWKGSKKRWRKSGGCPRCGSDLTKG